MNDNLVTILDLGTTKTVCLIGQKTPDDKIKILGYAESKSSGMNRGLVCNIAEASAVISQVVRQAEEMANTKVTKVYVGIAGQHITSQITSHIVTNKNQRELITQDLLNQLIAEVNRITLNPGEVVLQVYPIEYFVDNVRVKNPIGTMGLQLRGNFNIIVSKQKNIDILFKTLEMCKLECSKILIEPYASALATLNEEEREAGVCLIDIGGGTTDMIIFKDDIVRHVAIIPIAGRIITEDLREALKTTFDKAEKLKIQYGCAIEAMVKESDTVTIEGIGGRENREISLKAVASIIQARVHEIVDTVIHEIKNAGLYNQLGAGITITGGGSGLKNLAEFFEFRSGLNTRIGLPILKNISTSEDFSNPKYATAIGLLNRAISLDKELSNRQSNNYQPKTNKQPQTNNQQNQPNQNQDTSKKHTSILNKFKNYFDIFKDNDDKGQDRKI